MKKLTKKGTKIALISSISVFLTVLLVLSGVGIYFAIKKDKGNPAPTIVNPVEFSIDKWDGKSIDSSSFVSSYANRSSDTRTIDSASAFIYFINEVNDGNTFEGKTIYLNNSIDLNGYTIDSIAKGTSFKGTFDGGYYTIYNANINGKALFENTTNATIKNVGLYNCKINGQHKTAGLIAKAINTDIENVFVRGGNINGTITAGLVNEYVSSNGKHYIKNSFVDSNNLTAGLVASVETNSTSENQVTIENCYYTNSEEACPASAFVTEVNVIKAESITDFVDWDYNADYKQNTQWTDYAYVENSQQLNFNYPIQNGFTKVYMQGSYYESVVSINGISKDTTSIAEAVNLAGEHAEAEINLIVEKVVADTEAQVAEGTTVILDSTVETTIQRGEGNTGSIISATETGAKLILGNVITEDEVNSVSTSMEEQVDNKLILDGNSEYVKANNLQSGALVVTYSDEIEIGTNVVFQNNYNNMTDYGSALTIIANSDKKLEFVPHIYNCYSKEGGALTIIGALNLETSGGMIEGGVALLDETSAASMVNTLAQKYGSKNYVKPLAISITAEYICASSITTTFASRGLVCQNASRIVITDGAYIYNCYATGSSGGGIYTNGDILMTGGYIVDNKAGSVGGGVCCDGSSTTFYMVGGTIADNSAGSVGGAVSAGYIEIGGRGYSDPTWMYDSYRESIIMNNSAVGRGGALYGINYVKVSNAVVTGNLSKNMGGAIYTDGTVDVYRTTLNNNTASGKGGAIAAGGAVEVRQGADNLSELPEKYIELEYLEATGAQYIDTGVVGASNSTTTKLWAQATVAWYSTANQILLGSNISGCALQPFMLRGGWAYGYGSWTNNLYSVALGNIYEVENTLNYGTQQFFVNGKRITNTAYSANYNTGKNMYLFATNDNGTANYYCSARIYGKFYIAVNGTNVRRYIPCLNPSGVPGLYEANQGVFYPSATSTAFVAGPAKTSPKASMSSNYSQGGGGAVYAGGLVRINTVDVNNNATAGWGGAINSKGAVEIYSSSMNNNTAKDTGGAVYTQSTVLLDASTMSGNTAVNHGGAIFADGNVVVDESILRANVLGTGVEYPNGGAIKTGAKATITNSEFSYNTSPANGGAVFCTTADITNCIFSYNSAKWGAAVYGSEIVSKNTTYSYNKGYSSTGGGAIYQTSESKTVKITGGSIDYNTTSYTGGAIFAKGAVVIEGTSFVGNTSSSGGGAIISSSTVTINNTATNYSEFSNNTSNGSGGAIYATGAVTAQNTTFTNNKTNSVNGGAINCVGATLTNCSFNNNFAGGSGGAIHSTGTVILKDSYIINNNSNSSGGGVYVDAIRITVTNCVLNYNDGTNGGAIYSNGYVTITDSELNYNNVINGGAVHAGYDVNITNSSLNNNKASIRGGAIYSTAVVTITDSIASNNSAGDGGAIYCTKGVNSTNTVYTGNKVIGTGGAIYATEAVNVSSVESEGILLPSGYTQVEYIEATGTQKINTGVTFYGKFEIDMQFTDLSVRQLMGYAGSSDEYWGVSSAGYYELPGGTTNQIAADHNRHLFVHTYGFNGNSKSLTVDGVEIGNTTNFTGVDVSAKPYYLLGITSTTSYNCKARVYSFKAYNISNVLISHLVPCINSSGTIGMYDKVTGVFLSNAGTGEFVAGTPVGKSVFSNNASDGSGGAIYTMGGLKITNSEFNNNQTSGNGGALNVSGKLDIEDSTFNGNSGSNGGTIYVIWDEISLDNCVITNTKQGNAAIYISFGGAVNVNFEDCIIDNNNAMAIYAPFPADTSVINIVNSSISNNGGSGFYSETGYQEAVENYLYGPIVNVTNSQISNNNGYGISAGKIHVINSEFNGNKTALAADRGGEITINKLEEGDTTTVITGTIIDGNAQGGNYGSAISALNSNVEMYNTIVSNTTGTLAAVFADTLVMEDCSVINNSTPHAIYVKGSVQQAGYIKDCNIFNNTTTSGTTVYVMAELTLENSLIYNNTAAIIVASDFSGYEFRIIECDIRNNTASGNFGVIQANTNLTILNSSISNNTSTGSYGAVLNLADLESGYSTYVINSEFNNNTTSGSGGAIYARGSVYINDSTALTKAQEVDDTLTAGDIAGTTFIGNKSSSMTIYGVNIVMKNCIVNNNVGRGMYTMGTSTVVDSEICNNTMTDSAGSAIFSYGEVTIINSKFNNNSSAMVAGAVFSHESFYIINSEFNNNTAAEDGGAIYAGGAVNINNSTALTKAQEVDSTLSADDITRTIISGNTSGKGQENNLSASTGTGAAIYANGAVNADKVDISNNICAGAVYSNFESSIIHATAVTITNSTINNNKRTYCQICYGGIYSTGAVSLDNVTMVGNTFDMGLVTGTNLSVTNSIIINNTTRSPLGANGTTVLIENSIISNNDVNNSSPYIMHTEAINTAVTIKNSTFENSTGGIGIIGRNSTVTVVNSSFKNIGSANGMCGAIYTDADGSNVNIVNSEFINCSSPYAGGAVKATGSVNINNETALTAAGLTANDVIGTVFSNNVAVSDQTVFLSGGAIAAGGGANIENASFIKNKSTASLAYGGAIAVNGKLTLKNVDVIDSYGIGLGGAIYCGEFVAEDCIIQGTTGRNGGAVLAGKTTIINCTITDNTAKWAGGAIQSSSGDVTIINSVISNNKLLGLDDGSSYGGGAISAEGTVNIINSEFNNNSSVGNGGAIYTTGAVNINNATALTKAQEVDNTLTADDITRTIFNGNKSTGIQSTGNGGAIYSSSTVTVESSTIINNSLDGAEGTGGGIHATGDVTVSNSEIHNNKSMVNGGGIYSSANVVITDTNMNNNRDEYGSGGAIYAGKGVTITGSEGKIFTFNNNYAAGAGGAISAEGDVTITGGGTIEISYSVINEVYSGGIHGENVTLTNVNMFNNTAKAGFGGAVTANAKATLTNCVVSDNIVKGTFNDAGTNSGGGVTAATDLVIINSQITNNDASATNYGGGAYAGGTATIINSTISGNSVGQAGGGLYAVGAVVIVNSEFTSNTSSASGGAIWAGGAVNIINSELINNTATNGGAIYTDGAVNINNSTALTKAQEVDNTLTADDITGTIINKNRTSGMMTGMAIYGSDVSIAKANICYNTSTTTMVIWGAVCGTSSVSIIDSTIAYNEAITSYGQSAVNSHGDLHLENCSVYNNIGSAYALNSNNNATIVNCNIYNHETLGLLSTGNITIIDSKFTNNSSKTDYAGAIHANNGSANIINSEFNNNTTVGSGGAIYAYGAVNINNSTALTAAQAIDSTLTAEDITGTTFDGNSSGLTGGAIYAGGAVSISGGEFKENKATTGNGGAIYATGMINLGTSESTFVNNSANGNGGAIFGSVNRMNPSAQTTIKFISNSAKQGGAIYGNFGVIGADFTNNIATDGDGGAIYCEQYVGGNIKFNGNEASGKGGAIAVNPSSSNLCYIVNGEFVNNTSGDDGGAIYTSSQLNTFHINTSSATRLIGINAETTLFKGNSSLSDGGAIYTASTSGLSAEKITLTNNTATENGGAIYAVSTTNLTNIVLKDNTASNGKGGGIWCDYTTTITNSTIDGNSATGHGGGIWVGGTLTTTNCTFTNNCSGNYGGAIMSEYDSGGYYVYINGCKFEYNESVGRAGAVYGIEVVVNSIAATDTTEEIVSEFHYNYSAGQGGAIYANYPKINNAIVTHNISDSWAGGICAAIKATIVGGEYSHNEAVGGGAIQGDKIDATGAKFTYNTASGNFAAAVHGASTMNVTNCQFLYNWASWGGGAIRNSSGVMTVTGCTFTENSGSGGGAIEQDGTTAQLVVQNSTFTRNSSSNSGGAIHAYNIEITGSTFTSNTAGGSYGGAIYDSKGNGITIKGATKLINNSTAGAGGAIYTTGPLTVERIDLIYNNTATGNGGDIYCASMDIKASSITSIDRTLNVYAHDTTIGTVFVTTTSSANALLALNEIGLENDVRLSIVGTSLVIIEAGIPITVIPQQGRISYTYDTTITEYTTSSITVYANVGSRDLYHDQALTQVISSFSILRNGYVATGLYEEPFAGDIPIVNVNTAKFSVQYNNAITTVVYAQWTPVDYSINYNLAGGKLEANNPTTYNIESNAIVLNNPTREGYTFAGWTGTGLSSATTNVTIAKGSYGNRSYTATWTPVTYSITYNLGVGTATNPATYNITTATFTLNNPADVTEGRIKHKFVGWVGTGLSEVTPSVTIAVGSIGNREYTAVYTQEYVNHLYLIASNVSTYGTVSETEITGDTTDPVITKQEGNKINIAGTEVTATAKTGYIFSHWEITTDDTTATSEIIAVFEATIKVNITSTNSKNNTYGIIVYENNVEIGRYVTSFELAKGKAYKLKAFANVISNPADNMYQLLQLKVNNAYINDGFIYDAVNNALVDVTISTSTKDIEDKIDINFHYTTGHLMQIVYTTANVITGFSSLSTTNGILKEVASLKGYIISDNATINFKIVDNKYEGITDKYYYTGFYYTVAGGNRVFQGYSETGKEISYTNVSENEHSYSTSINVVKLEIEVLKEKTLELKATGNTTYPGTSTLSMKLSSEEGHVRIVEAGTATIALYASTWRINDLSIGEGYEISIALLQDYFGTNGIVYQDAKGYFVEIQ